MKRISHDLTHDDRRELCSAVIERYRLREIGVEEYMDLMKRLGVRHHEARELLPEQIVLYEDKRLEASHHYINTYLKR